MRPLFKAATLTLAASAAAYAGLVVADSVRSMIGYKRRGGRPLFNDPQFTPPPGAPKREVPVLYVHGITSQTLAFRPNAKYLRERGYWVWGYDYGAPFVPGVVGIGDLDEMVHELAENVDKVLAKTGAERLDIVAHSQGGLLTKLFIAAGGAEKVRRVVALGANFHGTDLHGRATRFSRVGERYPSAARRFVGPSAMQQLAGSSWSKERAGIPDTDPRVVYTSIYSPRDTIVSPTSASILTSIDGADTANIDVSAAYDGYFVPHPLMPRDPLLARLTAWGLEREVGDHVPPKRDTLPM